MSRADAGGAATSEDVAPSATTAAPSRRDLLIGGSLTAAAAIARWREPRRRQSSVPPGALDGIVPRAFGPWRMQPASSIVLPPPDALARMIYDQQVARSYVSDTEPTIMLVMAYGSGQNGALQMHRPEICYPASGYRLVEGVRSDLTVNGGKALPVRVFTAVSDTRTEQVLYWSRIADEMPTGWMAQRLAIMRSNFEGYIPDGLLVRISVISSDRPSSLAAIGRFCRAMLAAAGPQGRYRMLGRDYA